MIDNLICDPKKQISINLECILKFMNYLIFRDFLGIFINFYEFNSIYFELNEYKINFISHADMTIDVTQAKTVMPRSDI